MGLDVGRHNKRRKSLNLKKIRFIASHMNSNDTMPDVSIAAGAHFEEFIPV